MVSDPIRVIHFGVGAIGAEIVRFLVRRPNIAVVGAIDTAPDLVGRDLGEVVGLDRELGIKISDDIGGLRQMDAQVVTHSTSSYLPDVLLQLMTAAEQGLNVVSTCEELSYPWETYPALARQLDETARRCAVSVVGTGINPGFVMDTFALVLAGTCESVESIEILRHVNVATRRVQLQRKVGAGLNLEAFQERQASGRFGHVGLRESAWMLASGLGWQIEDFEHRLEPIPALEERESPDIIVPPGYAAGSDESLHAMIGGKARISMRLLMELGASEPRDEVHIKGNPNVDVVVRNGFQGDQATAAIVVNAIPHVAAARPGLLTMADLPLGFVRQDG